MRDRGVPKARLVRYGRTMRTIVFRSSVSLAVALAVGSASGCKKEPSTPEPAAAPAAVAPAENPAVSQARQLYASTCAVCHGASGRGDTPTAAALNPRPRNYSDKAWQASVTDDDLRKTILLGGAAVGKSPTMPGQPQLKDKPEVVDALVAMIREFGK